jgi:two-component system response regulator GlrR
MGQRVTIFEEEHGFPLGAEIREFLQREGGYQVNLVHQAAIPISNGIEKPLRIVIPVLSPSQENAKMLLAKFREARTGACLLPVVRSEILRDVFDVVVQSATDFLVAPLRELEVRARVRRVMNSIGDQSEIKAELATASVGPTPLVGEDPDFRAMKRKISLLAQSECTVLITGETGTGKELCARSLHYLSRRARGPFLPVNCAAIPVELFERELFGHQKGAFTGAWIAQSGLVEESEGGTLFLDEIEALSLTSQAKLLRFLQDQTYYSLGSPRSRQANVRIIASTNVELRSKMAEGTFREDLYHRLAGIGLFVPPLRQRTSDIPELVAHFWKIYMAKTDRPGRSLTQEAIEVMCQYSWPGNVRELQNVIQEIIVLGESKTVQPNDLPIPLRRSGDGSSAGRKSFRQGKVLAIEAFEKDYVASLLRVHQGNVTKAAHEANKDRRAFGRLIKKYDLSKS